MTDDEIVEIAGSLKDPRSPPPSIPREDERSPYMVLDSDDRAAVCDDTPFMALDSDDSTVDERKIAGRWLVHHMPTWRGTRETRVMIVWPLCCCYRRHGFSNSCRETAKTLAPSAPPPLVDW